MKVHVVEYCNKSPTIINAGSVAGILFGLEEAGTATISSLGSIIRN